LIENDDGRIIFNVATNFLCGRFGKLVHRSIGEHLSFKVGGSPALPTLSPLASAITAPTAFSAASALSPSLALPARPVSVPGTRSRTLDEQDGS